MCGIRVHWVSIFNGFKSARMRNSSLQRGLSYIRDAKRYGSNGVRPVSYDPKFESEREIKVPSECRGRFGDSEFMN